MNILLRNKLLALAVVSILVFISCSSSENTIIIEEAPTSSENTESTVSQESDQSFQQLTIGEINPIRSLDPLFADNASTMRALQLVYEGLVRYDNNGDVVPAIAKDWVISNNNQTYRFTLNNDLFYHDSDIFTNGLGRKLVAADIKYVFERMARADVTDKAAQLFMNIRGFEPYFQEQHQVMMQADRQFNSISGITVVNDSTITFSLVEPDSNFINKLATPYALIYPKQAVTANGFKAVGSGPFRLSQKRNDSLYIFARFENYRVQNQPVLTRVNIQTGTDETALLKSMSRGDIQLIPELGPNQLKMVLTSAGQLKSTLAGNYKLYSAPARSTMYVLKYHDGADVREDRVISTLDTISPDSLFADLPKEIIKLNWRVPALAGYNPVDTLKSLYSDDLFVRDLYSTFSSQLAGRDIIFKMQASRVLNRNIDFYTNKILPLYEDYVPKDRSREVFVRFDVASLGLSNHTVENIKLNAFPWWIDLQTATVSSTDNQ